MNRDIHTIYDVILKIIALSYGTTFLNYMGIEKEVKEIFSIEFTTLTGSKLYLDFLCSLTDETLCHIEFQFPKTKPEDLNRFFNYNIIPQVRYQKLTETIVFNFTSSKRKHPTRKIGKSKSFHPQYFYLGDLNLEEYFKNINTKVKSNEKLTTFEEITIMLICLNPEWKSKGETLKKISKLLKKEELFDSTKYEYIKSIIKLEIENLLTKEEQNSIEEEIKMTPQVQNIITQAINEVNMKVISETREEALAEGKKEGKKEGRIEAMKEIAKELKDIVDIETLSQKTGLSIEEIQNL